MKIPTEGKLLRIFIGESDRWEGRPLYEAIVARARAVGLAGATAWKGYMGFGAHSRLHTASVLRLAADPRGRHQHGAVLPHEPHGHEMDRPVRVEGGEFGDEARAEQLAGQGRLEKLGGLHPE